MEQEELLVKRSLKGDETAFREIIEGYKNYVFAIILNITKNQQEAENLAQETFLKVYSSLQHYQGQGFKGWIGKIAVHKAIDWNRKRQRESEGLVVYLQNQEVISPLSEPSAEERILKEEEVQKLRLTLQQLPIKYSGVLEKYFILALSYKEIAEMEGISIRTVESRLYRGKNLLREAWREEGYDATL